MFPISLLPRPKTPPVVVRCMTSWGILSPARPAYFYYRIRGRAIVHYEPLPLVRDMVFNLHIDPHIDLSHTTVKDITHDPMPRNKIQCRHCTWMLRHKDFDEYILPSKKHATHPDTPRYIWGPYSILMDHHDGQHYQCHIPTYIPHQEVRALLLELSRAIGEITWEGTDFTYTLPDRYPTVWSQWLVDTYIHLHRARYVHRIRKPPMTRTLVTAMYRGGVGDEVARYLSHHAHLEQPDPEAVMHQMARTQEVL
jgi:hypothetical protein